ncbi:MAG: coproporphyrinogen dehydrogenase HemZ [Oscillospiraceae bacterium]|nr:coproporphyrinogen dehydrogenase HemZ [Oscillospiraceae bacterium]MCI2036242.1 coproporphyrinogen dehydrogenase HemZ [Oscillospiraceae bacterium]
MTLVIDGHPFHYEMENLCRLFYPDSKIKTVSEPCEDTVLAYTGLKNRKDGNLLTVRLKIENSEKSSRELLAPGMDGREIQRRMAAALWKMFSEMLGYRPKWGILTGVRPVKLFGRLARKKGENAAAAYFQDRLLVSPEKTNLALKTMRNQRKILSASRPDSFSLYLSVPFCPTRCAYCSFVSSSVEKTFRLVPRYVELLCDETRRTGKIARSLHLRLQSVYIGGGTPTTLSADQLARVIGAVRESFDLSDCREFTVEAGRPDTVTEEKLDALKAGGVTRISINPQTLNEKVLREIGRKHTSEQTLSAFAMARRHGFDNINMDLIAGLPKDSLESFQNTIRGVMALSPECITVHTLALKRAARLNREEKPIFSGADTAGRMLDFADSALLQNGYRPYYLYRQSRMVGNLENTGWSKPGFESIYNVLIMEERQSILACGAGAVTKLKDPYADRIERVFNFKYPYEYINRYEEMMIRKERVKEFYGTSENEIRNLPQQRRGD